MNIVIVECKIERDIYFKHLLFSMFKDVQFSDAVYFNQKKLNVCYFCKEESFLHNVMSQWSWIHNVKLLVLAYLDIAKFSFSEFSLENLTI